MAGSYGNKNWKDTATKLTGYFRRFSDQPWAQRGAEVAQEWSHLLEQIHPDPAEIDRLVSTLEEGSRDGGSAWDEMLGSVKAWARHLSGISATR